MRTISFSRMTPVVVILCMLFVSSCTLLVKTNQPPGVCGDGVAKGEEACDGEDFRGKSCDSLGLGSGELACLQDCTVDTTGCTGASLCGNGVLDEGEQCDGQQLDGKTCDDVVTGSSGNLVCTDQCTFDSSGCDAANLCGNGILDEGEQCDHSAVVLACSVYGFSSSPTDSGCSQDCQLDFSPCHPNVFDLFDKVSTGAFHSCGIRQDNTVWCWGSNAHGQLGVPTDPVDFQVVPVQVFLQNNEPLQADQIGAGRAHTCALEVKFPGMDPRLFCWGDNQYGQLGTGNYIPFSTPLQVHHQNVKEGRLAVGHDHNCYFPLEDPRPVLCWGRNDSGQLGAGYTGNSPVPVPLHNPDILQYSHIVAGAQHTCGVVDYNHVYCWGNNGLGQLGTGDMTQKTQPSHVGFPDLSGFPSVNVLSISAGGEHTCVIFSPDSDYRLYCWGSNSHRQLGPMEVTNQPEPARVITAVTATMVSAGMHSTCLMDTAGNVTCWGKNDSGQLGIGSVDPVTAPGTFITIHGSQALFSVREMAIGDTHACAVEHGNQSKMFCWGKNDSGQLGIGNLGDRWVPTEVMR